MILIKVSILHLKGGEDMNNELKCRPYKVYVFIFLFFFFASFFCFILFGHSVLFGENTEVLMWGVACVAWCLLAKYCYNLSQVTISFEVDGLRLTNIKGVKEQYISYQKYLYGYYCRSYRGHLYLVISSVLLQEKQIKKLLNRSVWLNAILVKDTAVILLNNISKKDRLLIREIISKKLSFVKEL